MKHYYDTVSFLRSGLQAPGIGAGVQVKLAGTQTLATLFSDNGITQKPNPTAADSNGRFDFYVADGFYDIVFSATGMIPFTQFNVLIVDNTSTTLAESHSGLESFTGVPGLSLTALGSAPGSLGGTSLLYSKTLDNNLYYKKSDGTEIGPLGASGALGDPIINPNPTRFDVDMRFKGPNPYTDVTRYGVRGLTSASAIPAIAGITGSINSASQTLTVSTANCPAQAGSVCFVNGDGIVVYGAGPATALSTPGSPTVTPSVARVGTGTGDTVAGPTGATAYQYQIVARDKQGGLTAASTAGTTAIGQALLGSQSVAITSVTRSGNVNTYLTSSAHTLAVGAQVLIQSVADGTFNGTYSVDTVPDNTHFTVKTGLSTVNGASMSSTGGTVFWMNCNHITWTAVPNAWQYYIYGRTAGGMTLLGVTHPSGLLNDAVFDDFGSTMMAQSTLGIPGYVPSAPPGAATPQPLVTTISSGAGTTTLTLANAAATTVAGVTVLFTNGPNILTAAAAAQNLYWPITGAFFVVNSFTDVSAVSGANNAWMYTGNLVLNETMTFRGRWIGNVPNAVAGNAGASFNFMGEPTISTAANPGIFVPSSASTFFDQLAFVGGQNPVFIDAGGVPAGPQFGHHMYFSTVANSTDYMGIALYVRGQAGSVSTNNFIAGRLNVNTGPGQEGGGFTGSTFTPSFYITDSGGVIKIDALFMNDRGMLWRPDPAGGSLDIRSGYTQGGITPFILVSGPTAIGGGSGNIKVQHLIDDTTSQPFISYVLGPFAATLAVTFGPIDAAPSGGTSFITGPTQNWTVSAVNSGVGQNIFSVGGGSGTVTEGIFAPGSGAPGLYSTQNFNTGTAIGNAYKVFVNGTQMAAPVAAVAAGGSVSLGNHSYKIAPVWWDNSEGIYSVVSNTVTTTGGNQTIVLTFTPDPGKPKGYNVYDMVGQFRINDGGCGSTPMFGPTSPITITLGANCSGVGGGIAAAGPTMLMPGSQGVSAPTVITNQIFMSSTTFANLGTLANGTILFCPDCTIASPCAGAGTGALAKRLNGIWVCN